MKALKIAAAYGQTSNPYAHQVGQMDRKRKKDEKASVSHGRKVGLGAAAVGAAGLGAVHHLGKGKHLHNAIAADYNKVVSDRSSHNAFVKGVTESLGTAGLKVPKSSKKHFAHMKPSIKLNDAEKKIKSRIEKAQNMFGREGGAETKSFTNRVNKWKKENPRVVGHMNQEANATPQPMKENKTPSIRMRHVIGGAAIAGGIGYGAYRYRKHKKEKAREEELRQKTASNYTKQELATELHRRSKGKGLAPKSGVHGTVSHHARKGWGRGALAGAGAGALYTAHKVKQQEGSGPSLKGKGVAYGSNMLYGAMIGGALGSFPGAEAGEKAHKRKRKISRVPTEHLVAQHKQHLAKS